MLTFKFNQGFEHICDGYDVVHDGQVIGFIDVAGSFHNKGGALAEEEQVAVRSMCQRVYEMPSEWGVLGVGESPTEPFDQFIFKHPNWITF